MRIAVCDDCMNDAQLLKNILKGHRVSIYTDAGSLLADVESKDKIQYDLYFLDIFIEDSMNGIELARSLRSVQEEAVICFVSTSNDFYREAYDLYAVQYLLKPVQETDVKKLLDKVIRDLEPDSRQKLTFQFRGQTGTIPYKKILYISSRNHTISICCTNGIIQEYRGKLNDLEHQICGNTFMRCHQSFIVNMYYVERLRGTDLIVAGEQIPISRRYFAEVKRRYQEVLFEGVE